jgi:hypothetical protein
MNFAERIAQDRRLTILKLLEGALGYSTNDSLLYLALADFGHRIGRDQLRTDLVWMAKQGLIVAGQIAGITIVTATARGLDVAQGKAIVPGVKRPSPRL